MFLFLFCYNNLFTCAYIRTSECLNGAEQWPLYSDILSPPEPHARSFWGKPEGFMNTLLYATCSHVELRVFAECGKVGFLPEACRMCKQYPLSCPTKLDFWRPVSAGFLNYRKDSLTTTHTHTHITVFFFFFNQLWFLALTFNILCYHLLQVFCFNLFWLLHFNLG
jgi:hypothetical protein